MEFKIKHNAEQVELKKKQKKENKRKNREIVNAAKNKLATYKCQIQTTRVLSMKNSFHPSETNSSFPPKDIFNYKNSSSTTEMAIQTNTTPSSISPQSVSTP